ncbi:MAG: hypothetical protein ACT4QB_22760 [Gammaproteobacteria bacterium]
MTRLRTAIGRLVLIALVITASPGLGGVLYQSCPAGCCTPYGEETGCMGNAAAEAASEARDCSCQGTCDNGCSECAYFHASVTEPLRSSPRVACRFSADPPVAHLIGHPSRYYRPPPVTST